MELTSKGAGSVADRLRRPYGWAVGALSVGCGAAVAQSPTFALAPVGAFTVLGLAVVSVDAVLMAIVGVRNLTDLAAGSGAASVRGFDPSAAVGLVVIGVAALRLANPRLGHRVPRALVFLVAGLCAWFFVAVAYFGFDGSFSRELIRSVSIVAVAVIATANATEDAFERTAKVVLLATVVPAVVAIGEAAAHPGPLTHGSWRSHATFAHENTAAVAFGICAVLSFWFLHRGGSARYRAGVILFGAALITTGSLGGFAQTIVAFLTLWQALRPTGERGRRWLLPLVVGLVVVFALSPVGQARLSGLSTTRSPIAASQGQISNSLDWRFLNWSKFIDEWKSKPVLGYGLGTTTGVVTPLGNLTHSDYVRLLVETGLVGTALFGVLGFVLVRSVRRTSRSDPAGVSGATVVYALLLGLMTHALVEAVSLDTAPMYMIAALIGAVFATRATEQRSAQVT